MLTGRSVGWLALGGLTAIAAIVRVDGALAFTIGLAGAMSMAGSV